MPGHRAIVRNDVRNESRSLSVDMNVACGFVGKELVFDLVRREGWRLGFVAQIDKEQRCRKAGSAKPGVRHQAVVLDKDRLVTTAGLPKDNWPAGPLVSYAAVVSWTNCVKVKD